MKRFVNHGPFEATLFAMAVSAAQPDGATGYISRVRIIRKDGSAVLNERLHVDSEELRPKGGTSFQTIYLALYAAEIWAHANMRRLPARPRPVRTVDAHADDPVPTTRDAPEMPIQVLSMKGCTEVVVSVREDAPNQFRWVLRFEFFGRHAPTASDVVSAEAFPDEEAALSGARRYMRANRIGSLSY